jgi:hypothetical protein
MALNLALQLPVLNGNELREERGSLHSSSNISYDYCAELVANVPSL